MAFNHGNNGIVTDQLIYSVDTKDKNSYVGSGTAVIDLASGIEATLSGGPSFDASGYLDFDGSNDYMDTGFAPTNAICQDGFAWGYWFNWDNTNGNKIQGVLDTPPGTDSGRVYMGAYNYNFMTGCGSVFDTNTGGTIPIGEWLYCVMSFDGNETCRTYLNAELKHTMTGISFSINGNRNIIWGACDNDGSLLYNNNGQGALTHFYSKELSASEVLQNFNAQRERFGV